MEKLSRIERLKQDKDMLDTLTPLQRRILTLYGCIVTDAMLTHEYKERIEEQIKKCRTFEKANDLRTKLLAIKEYQREVIEKEFGEDDVIKTEDGSVDLDLYDELLEIDDSEKTKIK